MYNIIADMFEYNLLVRKQDLEDTYLYIFGDQWHIFNLLLIVVNDTGFQKINKTGTTHFSFPS